jgi:hypothetical protein
MKPKMDCDAMDRMLAAEEELVPSSGFAAAVMERVREEAIAPRPIPYPWKRAIPGLVLAAGVLGWGAWAAVQEAREFVLHPPQIPAAAMQPLETAGWIALALGFSLLSWLISQRMIQRSSLF